jgi:hypothetical protein
MTPKTTAPKTPWISVWAVWAVRPDGSKLDRFDARELAAEELRDCQAILNRAQTLIPDTETRQ